MNEVSAIELKHLLESNSSPFIIDVREKIEFYTYNIGGLHIPLGELPNQLEDLPEDLNTELIVVCQKGIRSRTAQKILEQAGYKNVKNLRGGLAAFHRI